MSDNLTKESIKRDAITLKDHLRNAAIAKRFSKHRLIFELLESNRIMNEDCRQIFALGEDVKRLRKALEEIIESEEVQAIRSYGLGDIAREALRPNEKLTHSDPP
jgi:hypothetical protein